MNGRLFTLIFVFVLGMLIVSGCGTTMAQSTAVLLTPAPRDWQTSTPEEQGIDSVKLNQMMDVIEKLDLPIDSVVVVRHGHIVFEEYPNPKYGPNDKHLLYSVTKSFTSALIGIAIEKGFIESVDQKVVDFFPERTIKNLDARKQSLTLEHLLTMSCGFEWEGPDDGLHTWGAANRSGNPVQFVLDQPMANDPGAEWYYNGGCSHLLSAILTKTTGYSTLEFARKYLFGPLGITDVRWPRDPQGIYYGGQDIWLTPRDMARFGQLYLNNGTWEGNQIVPAEWVAGSAETHLFHWIGGYGYQWWTFPQSGIYYASGAYEQRIYIVPNLDMVVVLTADNKASGLKKGEMRDDTPMVDWLLGRFILPACNAYAKTTYAKFGFSLDHPSAMFPKELGIRWEGGTATDISGQIQLQFGASPFDTIGVQWDTVESSPDLEAVLDEFSAVLENLGLEVKGKGTLASSIQDDHEMVYRHFNITERGVLYTGVIGTWYFTRPIGYTCSTMRPSPNSLPGKTHSQRSSDTSIPLSATD